MYRVVSQRESWFNVLLGEDRGAAQSGAQDAAGAPLPRALAEPLIMKLDAAQLDASRTQETGSHASVDAPAASPG